MSDCSNAIRFLLLWWKRYARLIKLFKEHQDRGDISIQLKTLKMGTLSIKNKLLQAISSC